MKYSFIIIIFIFWYATLPGWLSSLRRRRAACPVADKQRKASRPIRQWFPETRPTQNTDILRYYINYTPRLIKIISHTTETCPFNYKNSCGVINKCNFITRLRVPYRSRAPWCTRHVDVIRRCRGTARSTRPSCWSPDNPCLASGTCLSWRSFCPILDAATLLRGPSGRSASLAWGSACVAGCHISVGCGVCSRYGSWSWWERSGPLTTVASGTRAPSSRCYRNQNNCLRKIYIVLTVFESSIAFTLRNHSFIKSN